MRRTRHQQRCATSFRIAQQVRGKRFYKLVACNRKDPRDGKHMEVLGSLPAPDFFPICHCGFWPTDRIRRSERTIRCLLSRRKVKETQPLGQIRYIISCYGCAAGRLRVSASPAGLVALRPAPAMRKGTPRSYNSKSVQGVKEIRLRFSRVPSQYLCRRASSTEENDFIGFFIKISDRK